MTSTHLIDNLLLRVFALLFMLVTFPKSLSAENDSGLVSSSYLAIPIDNLQGDDVTVKDLVQNAVGLAKKAGAERLGFRGVAIADPAIESKKVSMNLTKVPFGKAHGYLADLTGCVLVESGGLCVLYPITLPQPQLVSGVFEPSQNAVGTLKLAQAKNPAEVRAILKSFGVVFPEAAETVYVASENVLYAKLPVREMEVLRSLLVLLDRGVGVTPHGKN